MALVVLTCLVAICLGLAGMLLYQRLPEITALTDYRPKQPLRVFTSDGVEIGQFGAERRYVMPIAQIPKLMQDAVVSVEDKRFREHGGVDLKGVLRAFVTNVISAARTQGGSTITQQVARNFYLSPRKTYTRKINEMLLAFKMESQLTKDQILELYMNQIFLGNRAYGFEAAAQTYFGKSLNTLSIAECAMLAGLPQNPSHANPVANFDRAKKRQGVVLQTMLGSGVISTDQFNAANTQALQIKGHLDADMHAEHVAEMIRQSLFAQFGEKAYNDGFSVITTLRSEDQKAAFKAMRKGLMAHERRQPYRGPEDEEELPASWAPSDPTTAQLLADYADDPDLRVAIVSSASTQEVVATLASGRVVSITGDGLKQAASALGHRVTAVGRIQRGSVIRVSQDLTPSEAWAIRQWPEAQGALVALNPKNGQINALVGGFDFSRNAFNHASQALRQPGSTFKPFLYSAALEQGVMPSSVINDAPMVTATSPGTPKWEPQNSDGSADGPITLRQALAKSKNLVSIRLVHLLGPQAARQWTSRFGFSPEQQPNNLTLALGAGSTTPLELASAYAVLANGGHRISAQLIEQISDAKDQVLFEGNAQTLSAQTRVIPARNAFITNSLLQEVVRSGTAARAQAVLKRADIYGKTGTTNDAVDAWFAGFHASSVAVVWMGYDNPRSLGSRESGGALSLPVWIEFMQHTLKGVPLSEPEVPKEVLKVDGDWLYSEWALGGQRTPIGFSDATDALGSAPATGASTP
jgi:penicillin-binding protein 1A